MHLSCSGPVSSWLPLTAGHPVLKRPFFKASLAPPLLATRCVTRRVVCKGCFKKTQTERLVGCEPMGIGKKPFTPKCTVTQMGELSHMVKVCETGASSARLTALAGGSDQAGQSCPSGHGAQDGLNSGWSSGFSMFTSFGFFPFP